MRNWRECFDGALSEGQGIFEREFSLKTILLRLVFKKIRIFAIKICGMPQIFSIRLCILNENNIWIS